MKVASFDGGRIGVVRGEQITEVSALVPDACAAWPPVSMVRFIERYAGDLGTVEAAADDGTAVPLSSVTLETPVQWPNKVIAFPANYHDHITEMSSSNRADINGFFLKASSSLSGPADSIVLPDIPGAEIHHECEVGMVMGRRGRHISEADALGHVFGYACLVDLTVRGRQERVMRKSFDTFTPVGPWVATADEVGDPNDLEMSLWINGELRQHANTSELILGMAQMVSLASSVMTLEPGDVIATGTCSGVGPVVPGDVVSIQVESVGSMELPVVQGTGGSNIAFEAAAAGKS